MTGGIGHTSTPHRFPVKVRINDSMIDVQAVNAEADGSPRLIYDVVKQEHKGWGRRIRKAIFLEPVSPPIPTIAEPVVAKAPGPFRRALDWVMG